MPLLYERIPSSETMKKKLAVHILLARNRRKQEEEQSHALERERREREQKKKQDSLTLEQTKEHISELEHKLEGLQSEKHELFSQLKKVLNKEKVQTQNICDLPLICAPLPIVSPSSTRLIGVGSSNNVVLHSPIQGTTVTTQYGASSPGYFTPPCVAYGEHNVTTSRTSDLTAASIHSRHRTSTSSRNHRKNYASSPTLSSTKYTSRAIKIKYNNVKYTNY